MSVTRAGRKSPRTARARKSGGGKDNEKHACVLAKGIIDAPPDKVYALFADAKRAKEFNEFCDECHDIARLDEHTKVSWSATKNFGPFRPRDFVTLCHFTKMKGGARCVVNRATTHPLRPVTEKYARGAILLAANVVEPAPNGRTRLTLLTQIDPAIDSKVGTKMNNALVVRSPGAFFTAVEKAAGGSSYRKKAAAGVAAAATAAGVSYLRAAAPFGERPARAGRGVAAAERGTARNKRRREKSRPAGVYKRPGGRHVPGSSAHDHRRGAGARRRDASRVSCTRSTR